MHLKNLFCQIHSYPNNLHLGLLLSGDWWYINYQSGT